MDASSFDVTQHGRFFVSDSLLIHLQSTRRLSQRCWRIAFRGTTRNSLTVVALAVILLVSAGTSFLLLLLSLRKNKKAPLIQSWHFPCVVVCVPGLFYIPRLCYRSNHSCSTRSGRSFKVVIRQLCSLARRVTLLRSPSSLFSCLLSGTEGRQR